jgi:hypothetical protein
VNLTISPQIRILALVGLVGIVALGGSMLMLGRSHSSTQPAAGERHGSAPARTMRSSAGPKAHVKPATAAKTTGAATRGKQTAPASAHNGATTHKTSKATAKHRTTATHKHAQATFRGNPVYADLPAPLQWQLSHHKVVVVSLYNPQAEVDTISVAEAHAGAIAAGAGFLLVSVLDNKVAGILTALLPGGGLLPEPGVLIYRAPGTIAVRLDGFADRDSVAQAAANTLAAPVAAAMPAAPAPPATATLPATVTP